MNIKITSFCSPFSFFCKAEDGKVAGLLENNYAESGFNHSFKTEVSDLNHGQYIAVLWNNKWTRGVVSMESQFLIWLIDHGFFLRPDGKTVHLDLPAEHKKYPTKIFEATLHGVCPVDKVLTEDCQIKNQISTSWNKGVVEKAKTLINSATSIYFVPVAILSTKFNDVVLGDVYLDIPGKRKINMVDELEMWPVFLHKDPKSYIENLSIYYTSRRYHRACTLKPEFSGYDLQTINLNITLDEYCTICANTANPTELEWLEECSTLTEDGSTVVAADGKSKKDKSAYRLTPAEIEKYSNMYVKIANTEFNVLNVLRNKIRDLNMCERYKNHDLKSVGRANVRKRSPDFYDH